MRKALGPATEPAPPHMPTLTASERGPRSYFFPQTRPRAGFSLFLRSTTSRAPRSAPEGAHSRCPREPRLHGGQRGYGPRLTHTHAPLHKPSRAPQPDGPAGTAATRRPPPGLGSLPRSARAPGASATMATSSSGDSSTAAGARRGEPGAERGPAG